MIYYKSKQLVTHLNTRNMKKIITLLTFTLFLAMPSFAAATSIGGASDILLEMTSYQNGDKKKKKAAKAAKKQRKHIAKTGVRKGCKNKKKFKKNKYRR